jgi:hypothetical protein
MCLACDSLEFVEMEPPLAVKPAELAPPVDLSSAAQPASPLAEPVSTES